MADTEDKQGTSARIGQKVIIAGGWNGEPLSSTKMLDLVDRRISSGGRMGMKGKPSMLLYSSLGERRCYLRWLVTTARHISTLWRNGWRGASAAGRHLTIWSREELTLLHLCYPGESSANQRNPRRAAMKSDVMKFLLIKSCTFTFCVLEWFLKMEQNVYIK